MYTWSSPARFNGLSNNINRHWWEMSGLQLPNSRPCFRNMCPCSSGFNNSKVFPTWKMYRQYSYTQLKIITINHITLTVSNCAFSKITIKRFSLSSFTSLAFLVKSNSVSSSVRLRFFPIVIQKLFTQYTRIFRN